MKHIKLELCFKVKKFLQYDKNIHVLKIFKFKKKLQIKVLLDARAYSTRHKIHKILLNLQRSSNSIEIIKSKYFLVHESQIHVMKIFQFKLTLKFWSSWNASYVLKLFKCEPSLQITKAPWKWVKSSSCYFCPS